MTFSDLQARANKTVSGMSTRKALLLKMLPGAQQPPTLAALMIFPVFQAAVGEPWRQSPATPGDQVENIRFYPRMVECRFGQCFRWIIGLQDNNTIEMTCSFEPPRGKTINVVSEQV